MRTLIVPPTWPNLAYAPGFPSGSAGGVVAASGGGGGFFPANVINNASFETNYSGFTNGSGGTPTASRDGTLAAPGGGSFSLKRTWVPSPVDAPESNNYALFGDYDQLWLRFYMRMTAQIDSVMKFVRFYSGDQNTNLGGFLIDDHLKLWTDRENTTAGQYEVNTPTTGAYLADSQWHYIELRYQRNGVAPDGTSWPNQQVWVDGAASYQPDGPVGGSPASTAYWLNGTLYAGSRASSAQLGCCAFSQTLNGGVTTTGQVNFDLIAFSSLGRIGP